MRDYYIGEIYAFVSEEISIFPPLFVRIDGHALIVKRYDYLATYIHTSDS